MAFNLASITTEAQAKAPRIVLLGVEKIGTMAMAYFSATLNHPFFLRSAR